MKSLFTIAAYGALILFSFGMVGYGLFSMFASGFRGDEIIPGVIIFSLGAILALVTFSMYALSAIVSSLKEITEKLIPLAIKGSMVKDSKPNPMADFINSLRKNMMNDNDDDDDNELPTSGTMTIMRVNDDGTHTPIERREFNSPEELQRLRDELINKALSKKDKKLEDMSVDELEVEREKAVEAQDFELATAIRDLINQRQGQK